MRRRGALLVSVALALARADAGVVDAVYPVCNGLSNQILGHVARLASAYDRGASATVPDAFIFNGVQRRHDARGGLRDELPTSRNSIPLERVLDLGPLRELFRGKGAELRLRSPVPSFSSCDDWLSSLRNADPETARAILRRIAPSKALRGIVRDRAAAASDGGDDDPQLRDGVCVHHRDGVDWREHCVSWEAINDGVWRKNCRELEKRSLEELVRARLTSIKPDNNKEKRLLYYVGDHQPPSDLGRSFRVFSRADVGRKNDLETLRRLDVPLRPEDVDPDSHVDLREAYRDVFAAVDFFACLEAKSFVGNSVSTFTTLQLILRNGDASWYNSYSVPLSTILPLFPVPILYTHTELGEESGKIALCISIRSVRTKMGASQPIHVLYHGRRDEEFLRWLKDNRVAVHHHDPVWADDVEKIRLAGDGGQNSLSSHLYQHAGNYLGSWQRVDAPLAIESEYVLYLDSDTVVAKDFSMADFGLEITPSVALAYEDETRTNRDAGVALLNVPKLRETRNKFLLFLKNVADSKGAKHLSEPSYQGALVDFYDPTTLDASFNHKPYFKHTFLRQEKRQDMRILHFHGAKPVNILRHFIGREEYFDPPERAVFKKGDDKSFCFSIRTLALVLNAETGLRKEFCRVHFYNQKHDQDVRMLTCDRFFRLLDSRDVTVNRAKVTVDSFENECDVYSRTVVGSYGGYWPVLFWSGPVVFVAWLLARKRILAWYARYDDAKKSRRE